MRCRVPELPRAWRAVTIPGTRRRTLYRLFWLGFLLGLENGKADRACEAAAPLDRVSHLCIPDNMKPIAHREPQEVDSMATSVSSNALDAKMSTHPGKL